MVAVTFEAWKQLREFLRRYPAILDYETKESGWDPIEAPDRYFDVELREPQHKDVAERVASHGGVMGPRSIGMWIQEELREEAHEKKPRKPTSICPLCQKVFTHTGQMMSPVCSACRPVKATWRAPPNAGPEFYRV